MSGIISIISDLLVAAIRLSTPITLAAIGATICERSGIVNIAMEGIMIVGAFFASIVALLTGNPWLGLLAGVISGGLFSLLHAYATVTLHLDHVVSGAVMNILAFGLTQFLLVVIIGHSGTTDTIPVTLQEFQWAIPGLSAIPILGPLLFNQTPIVYLSFLLIPGLWIFLFKTRTGLRIRAAGEHPLALATIGISVFKMRYLAVLVSGLCSGLAGAYLAIENSSAFTEGMTGGRGFIALAAMIAGRWNPIGAFLAALFFGFMDALQLRLQIVKLIPVPSELFIILPYLLAVLAVAGLVRKSRPPKAIGKDFMIEQEEEM